MSDFKIDFEWIDPLAARGAELRATWARLSMFVDDRPLTRVLDKKSRTVRDAVYLPLYPLTEWLAERWWSLWAEPHSSRTDYKRRHSMTYAREGYALPPLEIIPAGSIVLVSWRPETLPSHGVEFTERGEAWIETEALKDRFSSLIETVVTRLADSGITDSRLQQDWAAIQAADTGEALFCESVGALGLDPYDLDDARIREFERIGNLLPGEIVAEFFRSARPDLETFRTDANEVLEAVASAGRSTRERDLASLRDFAGSMSREGIMGTTPWEQGYLYAQRLRSHLGLDGKPLKTINEIGIALGMDGNEFERSLGSFSERSIPFAALTGINDHHSPTFILRPARPEASRFHLCRALFEYIHGPEGRNALVTDSDTMRQKRNRAFAAELLAPASALRSKVGTPDVTWEMAEELAEEFGVSVHVIDHQLKNHHIAEIRSD